MSSSSFDKDCNFLNSSLPLDGCPFIWKDFKRAGKYLTAFLEDVPHLATFNYEKIGFLRPPVDFYLRPFMLGVNKLIARKVSDLDLWLTLSEFDLKFSFGVPTNYL